MDCIETTPLRSACFGRTLSRSYATAASERNAKLDRLAAELRDQRIVATAKLLSGRPAFEITQKVVSDGHDLVVMTNNSSTNPEMGKSYGATMVRLLRICPCEILVIKGDEDRRFQRCVAAVDPQTVDAQRRELNWKILTRGMVLAKPEECEFDVIAAWSVFAESVLPLKYSDETLQSYIEATRCRAQQSLDRLLGRFTTDIHRWCVRLRKGEVDQVILDALRQRNADLLVIGTVGRKGLSGMLIGNTVETIIRKCDCSVLVVKSDQIVSPGKPDTSRSTRRESSGSSADVPHDTEPARDVHASLMPVRNYKSELNERAN